MSPYVYLICAGIVGVGVMLWRMRASRAPFEARPQGNSDSINIGPKTAKRRAQIASFGSLIELRPGAGEIRDESELPLAKAEMLDALMTELMLEPDLPRRDALAAAALVLCDFQCGVGPVPLSPLGYEIRLPTNTDSMSEAELVEVAKRIATNGGQERYAELATVVAAETDSVMTKIALAKQFANVMPSEKRDQLLAQ